jgi:SAM-dependent methyltransferase
MLFESNNICPVCQTNGNFWCETKDWEYRTTDQSYTYLNCPLCRTIFIQRVPQDQLLTIYPPHYYSFSEKPERLVFRLKNLLDGRFYKSILKKIDHPTLSVLDIGGGTGGTLDVLKKADPRISYTEIVDIDTGAEAAARKKGHQFTRSTIEELTTEKKFHVILLLNLVEHLANPLSVLDSLDARLFRNQYWGGLHCPRHWVLFSDQSFRLMIKPTNLTIDKMIFTQGAAFWAYSLLQSLSKKNIQLKRKPLIEHPLFAPLCVLFSAFDMTRSAFGKTSQLFIVLGK